MPGWVATRMGGPGASDDLAQGHLTQAWLAGSDDPEARLTGGYFYEAKRGGGGLARPGVAGWPSRLLPRRLRLGVGVRRWRTRLFYGPAWRWLSGRDAGGRRQEAAQAAIFVDKTKMRTAHRQC